MHVAHLCGLGMSGMAMGMGRSTSQLRSPRPVWCVQIRQHLRREGTFPWHARGLLGTPLLARPGALTLPVRRRTSQAHVCYPPPVRLTSSPPPHPTQAHFTEHMLFYSSEKYPKEDEYRCASWSD